MGDQAVERAQRELGRIVTGILVCFTLSGMSGLVYEVVWVRMLGLVFGHTVFAITTVLAAFMAGLGLGSFLLGRSADRQARPLRIYGLLEIGIGLSCLAVPFVMPGVTALYLALHRALALSFLAFSLAQFVLVFLVLLVPTTLMGATLPVLSRFVVADGESVGARVGVLYALNTFGAVLGTALAGYGMLPTFGMQGTVYLAATLNIGLGVLALVYDLHARMLAPSERTGAPTADEAAARGAAAPSLPALAAATIVGLGLSGAASMIYEIAWTRALSLVLGSSTYAFTSMLLAFLVGIAGGSAVFSRLARRRAVDPLAFAFVQLGIALTAILILPAFGQLPDLLLRVFAISLAPTFVLVVQVLVSILVMIAPTLLMGASFPCAVSVAARGVRHVGHDVGRIYAVNTLGAIVGSVAGGFVLIPLVGVATTVKVAVVVNLVVGCGLALLALPLAGRWRLATAGALTVATALAVVAVPAWNRSVMASGVTVYARLYTKLAGTTIGLGEVFAAEKLLFYEDGISSTVSVHKRGDNTYLRVNGKTDASTSGDMHTQLMLGHLPMLTHPHPRRVLVIGLGSGVTVGAVAEHPVERIDVVEIEPAVVRAARFFAGVNHDALADPRVHVTIADARNFLLSTSQQYDVIISEPSNPWIGGVATLFSDEFYALARSRLAREGIMLQWVHAYGLVPADLQMVVNTFQRSFPATSLWHAEGPGDVLLLGREQVRALDLQRVRAIYRENATLREELNGLGFRSAEAMLADFTLNEMDATRYAQNGDINSDDLLPLEFSAPRSLHLDTAELNFRTMMSFRTSDKPILTPASGTLDTAGIRYDLGMAYARQSLVGPAIAEFRNAITLDPAHVPARIELARMERIANRPLPALENLEIVLRRDPRNAEAYYELAQVYAGQQLPARAVELAGKAVAFGPGVARYHALYATMLEDGGRNEEAVTQYLAARQDEPREASVLDGLGNVYIKQGRAAEAVTVLREAVGYHPQDARLQQRLGAAYLAAHRGVEAVEVLTRAVRENPTFAPGYVNLGLAYEASGDTDAAIGALERALALDPAQVAASQRLSGLYAKVYGPQVMGR